MSPVDLSLDAGELRVSCSHEGGRLIAVFVGTADAQVDARLEAFLGRLHAAVERERADEVVVDIRQLEFMNSSCFKAFVTWIVQVRRMQAASQYRIRFLSSAHHHWQKRSLHAISYFGGDLIRIDTE